MGKVRVGFLIRMLHIIREVLVIPKEDTIVWVKGETLVILQAMTQIIMFVIPQPVALCRGIGE
jgi:hypothetical protein